MASVTPPTRFRSGVRLLLLSDTHVPSPGASQDDGARRSLERILTDVADLPDLDVVLVAGDVADDGSAAGGSAVRERIAEYARLHGSSQVYLPGNTDSRDGFRRAFGSGHLSVTGRDVATARFDGPECAAVSEHRGLRILTLDSTVPGALRGHLGPEQLSWLRQALASPAPNGTVVALHHPPLTVEDSPFLSAAALANPEDLADAIDGTDVRAVISGHFHAQVAGFLGSVPVWVCPGVESRVDLTPPRDRLRFLSDPAASVLNLPASGGPSFYTLHSRDREREMRTVPLPG